MEKKRDFIKILHYAKYLAFILATVCVFIFQFTAEAICITLALALYVVAFGLMFLTQVVHAVQIFGADKIVKKQHAEVVTEKEFNSETQVNEEEGVEVVNLKREKVLSVLGSVFFGLFTVFTFVVLILF